MTPESQACKKTAERAKFAATQLFCSHYLCTKSWVVFAGIWSNTWKWKPKAQGAVNSSPLLKDKHYLLTGISGVFGGDGIMTYSALVLLIAFCIHPPSRSWCFFEAHRVKCHLMCYRSLLLMLQYHWKIRSRILIFALFFAWKLCKLGCWEMSETGDE